MSVTLSPRARPPIAAKPRKTIWGPPQEVAPQVRAVDPASGSIRFFVTGKRPGDGTVPSMYSWFTNLVGNSRSGWHANWRPNSERPVLTLRRGRQTVEVRRATDWFDESADPKACLNAMHELASELSSFFSGAVPLATPAMTALDLWDRTVKHHFPPLPEEIRTLIHDTTGQGRIQLVQHDKPTIPQLVHLDARFAYAAITGDTFPVQFVGRDNDPEFLGYTPARYRVRFTVPKDWNHVGIFGVRGEDGWLYPDTPGETGETWADGCEVHLALRMRWKVEILERLIFSTAGARPLEAWRAKLLRLRERATDPLVHQALRAILLHGVGAFARRERPEVVLVPNGDTLEEHGISRDRVEGHGVLRGATWHLTVRQPLSAWSERYTHPEWSAHIWARMRCRVLSSPNGTGAFYVPRENLLAIETDGLYATKDPGWEDTGKVGEFRVKSRLDRESITPRSWNDLHLLREEAESACA